MNNLTPVLRHFATALRESPDSRVSLHTVIALLALYEGPIIMLGLIQVVGISDGGITYLVNELVRKGLVVRDSVPGDRRMLCVSLTPYGANICCEALALIEPPTEDTE